MGLISRVSSRTYRNLLPWHEPSKPLENRPEVKPHENNWPPKPPENPPHQPVASKNHTGTDQEPSLFEKSEGTKNPLNSSSENSLFRGSSEKLLKISRQI